MYPLLIQDSTYTFLIFSGPYSPIRPPCSILRVSTLKLWPSPAFVTTTLANPPRFLYYVVRLNHPLVHPRTIQLLKPEGVRVRCRLLA